MTRVAVLAERLYDMGIGLKKHTPSNLKRRKLRQECIRDLSAMQFLVYCIGIKRISDEDARAIIRVLDAYRHPRLQNFADSLLEANEEADYSEEYDGFLFEMASSLDYCVSILSSKQTAEYGAVCKAMWAFHNAPRAFLSLSHGMKISLQDARKWSATGTVRVRSE